MNVNLVSLIEQFGSEDRCRAYLEELRWPDGVECPRCEGRTISRIKARNQFDCDGCRYQFSVTAGTLFHDSHLPLWKWFLAIYLICESKKGISSKQLERTLGVSYKTAWYLSHRIRDAMGDADEPLLRGVVEIDETWIGGEARGKGQGYTRNKVSIVGAVERDGKLRLQALRGKPNKEQLFKFIRENVAKDSNAIYTDSNAAWLTLHREYPTHDKVNHGIREYVRGDVHTNTVESVWSLFKRSVAGSWHQISVKHLPAYLDEMEFRYNGRKNPFLFRDTLLALLHGDALPYKELTAPVHS
jgi:transposase-like protein